MLKKDARKKYLDIRNNITNKDTKSMEITNRFLSLTSLDSYKTIGLYFSFSSELNTKFLIDKLLSLGKIICVPRIIDNEMVFIRYYLNDKLEKNQYGIDEPLYKPENIISPKEIDLIIVPGVLFDKNLHRVGYGKGYYDKYLAKTHALKIALVFDELVIENIDGVNDYDIKMDKIITEKRIYSKWFYYN